MKHLSVDVDYNINVKGLFNYLKCEVMKLLNPSTDARC